MYGDSESIENYEPPSNQAMVKGKGKKLNDVLASQDSLNSRYLHAICQDDEAEWPAHIFIIGSSLDNVELFTAVQKLSEDVPISVVNPEWRPRFGQLRNVEHIKATAEEFADAVLREINDGFSASN